MTSTDKREAVVALLLTRVKKNKYTQGAKRDQVFLEPTGYGDCSSTVRAGYKRALGIDIGTNTATQIVSKTGFDIDIGNGAAYPNESKLKLGDLLYFKGTDASRPFSVGHVEMYIGNNQLLGHGSGTGPTIKKLKTYCKGRMTSNRGYIKTRRIIADAAEVSEPSPDYIAPANPLDTLSNGVRITGGTVNLRAGPSTDFAVVGTVKQGAILASVDTQGWQPVLVNGTVVWVSDKYSERP